MNPQINQCSKHLFWDVNKENLNLETNKGYIIKQVLEYGLIEDWVLNYRYYGINHIAKVTQTFRDLDQKALSFISLLSKTPLYKFKCYTSKQSAPPHWNF